ncbi:unnamed protein product [Nippostrongylus brasiliensis]|uniref:Opaque-phase-specific protein OP4 n=1 Tax=Nippostrongylus brasiliensis TaxID=27835 RepID=A0A0N4YLZ4_NIPBR|nr:unnamed protein product [Nippostrongylus brasiliensis]
MLQDISTLLDAAIAQMQQYTAVFGPSASVPMPPAGTWPTAFGQDVNQGFEGTSELDVTQSDSVQGLATADSKTKETKTHQNGTNDENAAAEQPSTSKSLFGPSMANSHSVKSLSGLDEGLTAEEDMESPETPSSSREPIVRSAVDEEVRLRRLKRFGEAGNASEDN